MIFNKEHLVWIKDWAKKEVEQQKEELASMTRGELKDYSLQYKENIQELEEMIDICNNPTKLEQALK